MDWSEKYCAAELHVKIKSKNGMSEIRKAIRNDLEFRYLQLKSKLGDFDELKAIGNAIDFTPKHGKKSTLRGKNQLTFCTSFLSLLIFSFFLFYFFGFSYISTYGTEFTFTVR